MTGISLSITTEGMEAALATVDRIAGFERALLMESAAAILESGARRRIGEEKVGPDGEAWAPWSATYAVSRGRGQSLLQAEGDLLDSTAPRSASDEAVVGSNLVYSAIHQMGGEAGRERARVTIPARPYLGMSSEDQADIEDLVISYTTGLVQ